MTEFAFWIILLRTKQIKTKQNKTKQNKTGIICFLCTKHTLQKDKQIMTFSFLMNK